MNIEIRTTRKEDYQSTEHVIREAFWNVYGPGCEDHYMVHQMRKHPTFVSELDVVAVVDGKIVGNIVYLTSYIQKDDDTKQEVLSLGPIAVLPEYQKNNIGSLLISYTKAKAQELGYQAILLCGNHRFYSKNGFERAESYNVRNSDNFYFDGLHICLLQSNIDVSGRYYEDEIYLVDQKEAELFDLQFPYKEKIENTPSQLQFQEDLLKLRPYKNK